MSTPQNLPENHEFDAEPSDPSLNKPPSESPEPELAGEEEEGECGFCLFMKGGGCKDTFVDWENCVKDAEDKSEDLVEKCSEVTARLKLCMDSHSDYYEPILRAEKHAEEQVAIELEKEKQDSEASKNQQEAPSSQSNQKFCRFVSYAICTGISFNSVPLMSRWRRFISFPMSSGISARFPQWNNNNVCRL